ncbi:membrane protein insertion efficiency factor YidD [Mycobacterium sp. E1747]|uniref:membrane protein insertion efficiency factor YidD n=1 Tax=Mycobacterium sp. E1747 TaxID=1834128 RepID=UPI0009EF6D39|nr:membrane protein insertion efficiency factor YidD [Mycobacterium sp. E1747]
MTATAPARTAIRTAGSAAARGLIWLIELYRHMISPLRPATCRFMPTCSQYAVDALTEYGVGRGSWLAVVRLGKCGPWHRGGWDPIPERSESKHFEDVSVAAACPAARGESGTLV